MIVNKSQKKDPKTGLNYRQQRFLDEFLKSGNGADAARRAGYANKTARQTSDRLRTNKYISDQIKLRTGQSAMEADEVLERLAEQARMNINMFIKKETIFTEGENEVNKLSLDWDAIEKYGHLIKSITATAHGPKLELHDGQTALIHLGKHHRLFIDRHELDLPLEIIQAIGFDANKI